MRPNRTGWVLVAFFLLAGIGFWIAIPEIFIGQIWVAVALLLAVVYAGMNRRADQAEELKRTGIQGQAKIVEMTQTGTYINEQPRVKMKLSISAPGVAPFEDERTETVPLIALGRLSSGVPLVVYMKPEDPQGYVIDWGGTPGSVQGAAGAGPITVSPSGGGSFNLGSDPDAQQAVLQALQEQGVDTSSGSVDLRQAGPARDAVLEALRKHGIDVAHQVAVEDPAVPISDSGEPMERLTKLRQLRDANLISAAEYDKYRKDILEDL